MTLDELERLAAEERAAQRKTACWLHVCTAASCLSAGAAEVKQALEQELAERGMLNFCKVKGVGCMGLCSAGPLVAAQPEGFLYGRVTPDDAPDITRSLVEGRPLRRLAVPGDLPFFRRQFKIVLENAGRVDPERLEDYVAAGGYASLLKVLNEMTPQDVIREVTASGLRGRGGAGYPTGLKWSTVAKSQDREKYVVCNADEGDPGAFMDRAVLESDPHRVLEGMAIAAYATGARHGYIYVRAEYPLAVARLRAAIRQAERAGLLGNRIAGTPFSFHVEVRLGAGAFVCGEETALMASIEGRRGTPRPRPPYPAESGLWGHSTLINNVETLANVPVILREGGEWYARIGTPNSKGTKVFALAGRVLHTGLIEVPMGISLREIIFEIGGGVPEGRRFKAVQTGGPSGGCIPEEYLDTPVDYESLSALGSMMGSGGLIVMDDSTCMVDLARFFLEFSKGESCGKCVPCRVGTAHLYDLLDRILRGESDGAALAMLEELSDLLRHTSLCGLGQSAPNPVLSTLRHFRHEYEAHLEGRCVAGACRTGERR
ncbi:MAG: NADH-quinone oxidoreductase subunit NuoF [Bryobacterales bacterium]|nr:NADH-quinone oxidoreductase subunit NuoF [Bryobacteraceae bacterium]MDW8130550.1 NADH-quinone oxidoreductase subunit NuoF [Bryobacterales bacterium]